MIENLKELKDTYENTRLAIDKGKEPMEDLLKLKNFIAVVAEDTQGFLDKIKEDKDYMKFFLDDFTVGLLKRLTRERSRDDKVSYESFIEISL